MVRYNNLFIYNYSGRKGKSRLNDLINHIPHTITFLYDESYGQRIKVTNWTIYD